MSLVILWDTLVLPLDPPGPFWPTSCPLGTLKARPLTPMHHEGLPFNALGPSSPTF